MKKKRKILLILSIVISLSLFAALAACSAYSGFIDPYDTERGTVTTPEHKGESEPADTSSTSNDDNYSDSLPEEDDEESNYETTDPTYEEETEQETTPPVIPTLEFTSLGNGTCAVTGIGTVTASYVVIPQKSPDGDVVAEIGEKAFYACDFIRAVEIPSTVSVIGDMAFADCSELVYIAVDESNKMFTDLGGVLYSSDMTRIVAYPSASGAASITIPETVTVISPMAFYNCDALKTINFEGSFDKWSKIIIGDMNYSLYTASILCRESK